MMTSLAGREPALDINGQSPDFPRRRRPTGHYSRFPGLDQITITLPSSLAGSGLATLSSTLGGIAANDVTIAFK